MCSDGLTGVPSRRRMNCVAYVRRCAHDAERAHPRSGLPSSRCVARPGSRSSSSHQRCRTCSRGSRGARGSFARPCLRPRPNQSVGFGTRQRTHHGYSCWTHLANWTHHGHSCWTHLASCRPNQPVGFWHRQRTHHDCSCWAAHLANWTHHGYSCWARHANCRPNQPVGFEHQWCRRHADRALPEP